MIVFKCKSCGTVMAEPECNAGQSVSCAMCNEVLVTPTESEKGVKPPKIMARRVSGSTYQIDCPRCGGSTNFRESSLGGEHEMPKLRLQNQIARQNDVRRLSWLFGGIAVLRHGRGLFGLSHLVAALLTQVANVSFCCWQRS